MFQARWSTRRSETAVSSSAPEPTNQEAILVRKAAADAIAVRELAGNPEITDEIIGFHAQQAIEKWLKALMAHRGLLQWLHIRLYDQIRGGLCYSSRSSLSTSSISAGVAASSR